MISANIEGIPRIEFMVTSSGVTESHNNKFIVIPQDVLITLLKTNYPTGRECAWSIYRKFSKYSYCKAVLIYQRMYRKDNQALAKEFLGNDFRFTTDLYNTLSSLKENNRHRGNSTPLYIIYDDSKDNFDMKNALSIFNQSVISYFNKDDISLEIKNLVELPYPPYESWRWKTHSEIKCADYRYKYYEKHNVTKRVRLTSDEKILDNIKEMCNNYFKSLIDRNEYEKVEDSFLDIYDVMDMNRRESRYNKRHNIH